MTIPSSIYSLPALFLTISINAGCDYYTGHEVTHYVGIIASSFFILAIFGFFFILGIIAENGKSK